ncbi:HlyD family type I secretion periplasmic adaptor subunit [Poseidonibacter lekithochrous]|uniref:HlyD family type I secretion periplasmic adaptor subunit n=1 Tax=Poseidonibacter TaxID=2321187 RepID=UPI001C0846E7|nr:MULTISPECIES: HlyD family type I secretion periplasmic adaptor subunit [Poseidonibacter]MBU3014045.1 HlyD family type I secretion periplasmic adaptor subunit [Poseidonibacter lekithochrous]MDO6827341.1 HlyD family type I secretion periplasmic adaptor subunit [Poseidonibacter sp. 1_MG-2023]
MAKIKDNSKAFFEKTPKLSKKALSANDFEYMNSLSAAVIHTVPRKLHWVLISFLLTITLFLLWASFAEIDEIARGNGKVVPNGQNQIVQNLEGGIVSEILVKEGDFVEKDQILIKISNEKSNSTVASNELKAFYLQAQIKRLESELKKEPFTFKTIENEILRDFLENENELYLTNKKQLDSRIMILKEQIKQKENELKDARQTIGHMRFSVNAISKEVEMTRPMVKRGIRSQVDFLKLQREQSDAKQKLQSVVLSVSKIKSEILEIKKKIDETYQVADVETREKLNDTITSLKDLKANSVASTDQVLRTIVKSPSNGIVQKLHLNTIGGSVKPAQDLIEIVPTDYKLIVEVKILPKDIAFIYHGQKAIVKFSAYDFSIYGGLDGKVISISPDTITEKDDKTYYLVRIETEKNFIGDKEKSMKIIPGMVADVDIITGKKTILDYILKPILKTKQYTFTER